MTIANVQTEKPSTASPRSWPGMANVVCLVAIAVATMAGAAIRLHDISHSLWLDELHTAWCVAEGFDVVAQRARMGNYAPLYFWIVFGSVEAFGFTEIAVRLPSLLAGIALIPLVACFTLRLTGSRLGVVVAAVAVALDTFLFAWYAQEARSYALVQCFGVAHVWLLWSITRRPTLRRRAAFIAVTVLLFYLHYTAILILTGEVVWIVAAALMRRVPGAPLLALDGGSASLRSWTHPTRLAIDLAVAALFFLPALGHLQEVFARRDLWTAISPDDPLTIFPVLPLVGALALSAFLVHTYRRIVTASRARPRDGTPDSPTPDRPIADNQLVAGFALVTCWLLVPLCVAFAAEHAEIASLFTRRYLLVSAPALAVAAGMAIAMLPTSYVRGAVAVILLFAWQVQPVGRPWLESPWREGALANYLSKETPATFTAHRSDDWRAAVDFVSKHTDNPAETPVLLLPGLIEESPHPRRDSYPQRREYLLFPITGMYSLEAHPLMPLQRSASGAIPRDTLERLRLARAVWVIVRGRGVDSYDWLEGIAYTLNRANIRARLGAKVLFDGYSLCVGRLEIEPRAAAK